MLETSEFEQTIKRERGYRLIIGIDEAGRGPLAGPVVASAVLLNDDDFQSPIRDSKKLTERQREKACVEIFEKAQVGVGIISSSVIDQVNILEATYLAMSRAVRQLLYKYYADHKQDEKFIQQFCLLVDGNRFKSDLRIDYVTVVQGDSKVLSIACASIVAKVTRDRIIKAYDQVFPGYGLAQHKGYPTVKHKEALRQYGPSPIHRRTFKY